MEELSYISRHRSLPDNRLLQQTCCQKEICSSGIMARCAESPMLDEGSLIPERTFCTRRLEMERMKSGGGSREEVEPT
jgi:hypothetical protein